MRTDEAAHAVYSHPVTAKPGSEAPGGSQHASGKQRQTDGIGKPSHLCSKRPIMSIVEDAECEPEGKGNEHEIYRALSVCRPVPDTGDGSQAGD